jgi:hypothetical protein
MKHLNRGVRAAIGTSVVLAATATASADPVRIVQDNRITSVSARVNNTVQTDVDTGRDVLMSTATVTNGGSSAVASASVTSSFADPMHWFGIGTADALTTTQGSLGAFTSAAAFGATFDVTEPVAYAFNGRFNTSSFISQPPSGGGDSDWSFFLAQQTGGGPLPTFFSEQGRGGAVRSFVGTLAPNEYLMVVIARNEGSIRAAGTRSADAGFNFTFDLTALDNAPVPEPASMLLLGTGLAGLFGCGSRVGKRRRTVSPS